MKERPIIMTGESVRAILDGRKPQTRRVIKPQPEFYPENEVRKWEWHSKNGRIATFWVDDGKGSILLAKNCPYGQPGDRLWVKETWQDYCPLWNGAWCGCGSKEMQEKTHKPVYRATPDNRTHLRWKSPRFMPRWASRILLEVTDIRVERVQDITEEDAKAEGARPAAILASKEGVGTLLEFYDDPILINFKIGQAELPKYPATRGSETKGSYVVGFWDIWTRLNAKRGFSWESNPWVWVITFKRL